MVPVPLLELTPTPTTPLQKSVHQLQKQDFEITDTPEDPEQEDPEPTARTLHLPESGVKTDPLATLDKENP